MFRSNFGLNLYIFLRLTTLFVFFLILWEQMRGGGGEQFGVYWVYCFPTLYNVSLWCTGIHNNRNTSYAIRIVAIEYSDSPFPIDMPARKKEH